MIIIKIIKIKTSIFLFLIILYVFLIPDKFSIIHTLTMFYDLPSLLISVFVPLILIFIKKQINNLVINISLPISILFSICWSFSLPRESLFLILLPIIYGLAISILISIIDYFSHNKLVLWGKNRI